MRSIVWTVLAITMLSAMVPIVGVAAPQTGPDEQITDDFDFQNLSEGARSGAYYRTHARISSQSAAESERSLVNGVRWRLLVDERTGMRMPRITWMPDRQGMVTANSFLEMAHGAAIAKADDFNRLWLGNNTIRKAVRSLPPYSPRPLQSDVELTYATSRFVNYIDLGIEEASETSLFQRADIRIVDIEAGTVFDLDLCPIRHDWDRHGRPIPRPIDPVAPFVVCDDATHAAFWAVVQRWVLRAIPEEERAGKPDLQGCTRAAHILARWERPMMPYLTPRGLAILLGDRLPVVPQANCRSAAGDPVVVPYRALAQFMHPGPLSRELLGSK